VLTLTCAHNSEALMAEVPVESARSWRRLWPLPLLAAHATLTAGALYLPLVLIVVAETAGGRLCGIAAAAAVAAPMLAWLC
jgi:hypothetical protein